MKKDVENDTLKVYCNGDIVYKIKGVTAKVSVIWNYTFPKGGGDTHFSVMKGSKADLVIRQGKEQNYQPELFVEAVKGMDLAAYEKDLTASMEKVSAEYPGVALKYSPLDGDTIKMAKSASSAYGKSKSPQNTV